MGRMHAPGKGISSSAIPYRRSVPSWQKQSAEEIKDVIYKLAKKGYKPSLIGVHLRDTYGVGKSHYLTGSKILRVLKSMSCTRTSRRSLLHDQACCWHEKTFGKKPKGQGR